MVLYGGILGRCIVNGRAVVVQIFNICARCWQIAYCAEGIGQIQTAEAVTVVCAVDENIRAALYEADGVLGLYPGGIALREYGAHKTAITGPVLVKVHMVLAAVHNLGVDVLAVRAPGDVGDIAFLREISNVQPYGFFADNVKNTYGNVLRGHSVHGIIDFLEAAGAGFYVQKRELCDLSLVLAVEGHFCRIRRHKPAGVDAKLVAAYSLAIDYAGVVGQGDGDCAIGPIVTGK